MPAQAEGKARGWYRWYKRQMRNQAGRMLAIGDGANDVAMIQVRCTTLQPAALLLTQGGALVCAGRAAVAGNTEICPQLFSRHA